MRCAVDDDTARDGPLARRAAAPLMRRPEAVAGVLVVGLVMGARFLAEVGKGAAGGAMARMQALVYARGLEGRVGKRLKEKRFLESAVEATEAEVENLGRYLSAQVERARVAEDKLEELAVVRADVESTGELVRERRGALSVVERELEAEKGRKEVNWATVERLESAVEERTCALKKLEEDSALAQKVLLEAEESARRRSASAKADENALRGMLAEKQKLLLEETARHQDERARLHGAEEKVQSEQSKFQMTMSELSRQKEALLLMEEQAAKLERSIEDMRSFRHTVKEEEADLDAVKSSMQRAVEKQQELRGKIQNKDDILRITDTSTAKLRAELDARESALADLKQKLEYSEHRGSIPISATDHVASGLSQSELGRIRSDATADQDAAARLVANARSIVNAVEENKDLPAVENSSNQDVVLTASERIKAATRDSKAAVKAAAREDAITSTLASVVEEQASKAAAESAPVDVQVAFASSAAAPKKRRGRPRKMASPAPSSTRKESSGDDSCVPAPAPKRGRGRPRKVATAVVSSEEEKISRGRPSKLQ